jgi:hypothetical protein
VTARRALLAPLLMLLAAHGATPVARAEEPRISARLQPGVIGVNELAHLSIEVQGDGFGNRGFEPTFELENLEVVGGPNSSQSFRFVNGAASRSLTLSWVLRPLAIGPASVRSIQVQVDDTVYAPPDQEIEVQHDTVGRADGREPAPSRDPFEDFFSGFERRRPRAPNRQVYLRAEVQPKDPYVGQQALYTLYLLTQTSVTSISPEKLPDFSGFWVRELPQPEESEVEMVEIDGERFRRVAVLRRALFPLRPGATELEPAKIQLGVRIPDSTFGSMFFQNEVWRRDSNPIGLTVRELPEGAPPGYTGAVGELAVTTALEPRSVAAGDAATFTVTLSGAGHLQGLPAPALPELSGLRTFPPQQRSDETLAGTRVRGRRSWSYVLVPEAPGEYVLPEIEVPYFDPSTAEYRVARAPVSALTVSAPALPAAAVEPAEADSPPAPIAASAGSPPDTALAWDRILPWVLVVLLVGMLAAFLRRGGLHAAGASPAGNLQHHLRQAGAKIKPREAAALIEDGWRHFLEARWNIPTGTPSTQWGRLLSETGAPADAAEALVQLADDLHYLRYAPQLSDTAALQEELILRSTKLGRTLK